MENLENTNIEGQENTDTQERTYTQAEVDEMIQRAADQRVTQALKTAEKKNAAKIAEAEKLAKMSEQDKYIYQLEQREKEVAEKEKQLAMAEMRTEVQKALGAKGLDLSLADLVVNEDAEVTANNIKALEKAFTSAVRAEVAKRLASKAPTTSIGNKGQITKDEFNKMNYAQRMALKTEDEELYHMLCN